MKHFSELYIYKKPHSPKSWWGCLDNNCLSYPRFLSSFIIFLMVQHWKPAICMHFYRPWLCSSCKTLILMWQRRVLNILVNLISVYVSYNLTSSFPVLNLLFCSKSHITAYFQYFPFFVVKRNLLLFPFFLSI